MTRIDRARLDARFPAPFPEDAPGSLPQLPPERLDASLRDWLSARRADATPVWVFAYGSLLWHPELEFSASVPARVHGWHRRFCLWQWAYRGSRECPGLMLALDAGGAVKGLVYRVDPPDLEEKLRAVWHRELRGGGYLARRVRAHTGEGPVEALTFVINRAGPRYSGRLPAASVAHHVARACGSRGPSAEYLYRLTRTLEALGLEDDAMRALEAEVAARLGAS